MKTTFEKTTEGNLLAIEGDVTLSQIQEMKREILAGLAQEEPFTLDIQGVTSLDLAALQVLGAAHYSAVKQNRELKVLGRDREIYRQAVIDSGFCRNRSCKRRNKGHVCLWVLEH